jgi:transcriptional regulator with XRE-family HTH domain
MVNAEQIRAARGWLNLSQDDLARRSGVAKRTIARIEQDVSVPYDRTLRDLQSCLEEMGIEFLFEGAKGVGVRLRSDPDPPSAKPRKT